LDRRFLGTGGRETHRENLEFLGLDEMSFFGVDADELPRADVRLKEGDRVFDMDLVVLETPGHTPGSVCLYAEKEGILFSGDTLFFDGVGRSDLPGGSEKKLRESIQKKIAVLPPETRVFPGHGPFTTIEREKRGNVYLKDMLQESRPVLVQRSPLIALRQAAAAEKPSVPAAQGEPRTANRPAAKRPTSAGKKLPAKRPAAASKTALDKRSSPKRGAAGAERPKRGAAPLVRRPAPPAKKTGKSAAGQNRARSAPADRAGKSVQRKRPVVVKKGPGSLPARRKSAQATRSTKAPGAGRKPAR